MAHQEENEKTPRQESRREAFWRILWNGKGKLVGLNLLFVLCSLPLVTIGPAMAAMTEVLRDLVNERIVFVCPDFFGAMKKHWKQALPMGIVRLFLVLADLCAIWYYAAWLAQSGQNAAVPVLALLVAVLVGVAVLFSGFYLYPLLVGCALPVGAVAKNAVLLGLAEGKSNLVTAACGGAVLLLLLSPTLFISVWFYPISLLLLLLFGAAVPGFVVVFRTQKYITQYVTDPYYQEHGGEAASRPPHL